MGTSLKIEGLAAAQKALRDVDRALPKELRAFNKNAATIVSDESKRLAPVGPTGRLRNAHTIKAGQRSAELKIGSNVRVPYAGPVVGGDKQRPQGGYMIPNKFPFQALKNKSRELRKAYDDGIDKLLKRLL